MDNNQIIDQVLINLRRIMRAIDLHSRKLAADYKLTGPQLFLLKMIKSEGSMTLGRLAKCTCLSNATVTGIVDRLEKRGLVERIRSDRDRRQVFVAITDSAESILRSAPPPLQDQFVSRLRQLDHSEQNQILGCLSKLAGMMDADDLDASSVLSSQALLAGDDSLRQSD
jgi:DNA-binding MarR family transcriptional regulator